MKRAAVILATVGGAGYFPIAPGTVGSAVGVLVYWFTRQWPFSWQLGLVAAVTVVGTWAAGVAAGHFGREDPGHVVIDEVAGQLVTLLLTGAGLSGAVIGFFVFRLFDIIKPWPANRFERLLWRHRHHGRRSGGRRVREPRAVGNRVCRSALGVVHN